MNNNKHRFKLFLMISSILMFISSQESTANENYFLFAPKEIIHSIFYLLPNEKDQHALRLTCKQIKNFFKTFPYTFKELKSDKKTIKSICLSSDHNQVLFLHKYQDDDSNFFSFIINLFFRNEDDERKLYNSRTADVYSVETSMLMGTLEHSRYITSASFNFDGTKILTASYDATARVWDSKTKKCLLILHHNDLIHSAFFNSDSKKILTASCDKTIKLWNSTTGELLKTINPNLIINFVSLNSDETKILTISYMSVSIWEIASGNLLHSFDHDSVVHSTFFSPDEKKIIVRVGKSIKIWNLETNELFKSLDHPSKVTSVDFAFCNTQLVTLSEDNVLRFWSMQLGEELSNLKLSDCKVSASIDSENYKILIKDDSTNVKIWDMRMQEILHTLNHNNKVDLAFFISNGKKVVTKSNQVVRIWDLNSIPKYLDEKRN